MFKTLRLILTCSVLAFSANTLAMTIADKQPDTDAAKVNAADNTSAPESTLHGNLTSLSPERVLKTSVGEFQLGASTRVNDRRLNPEAPTKVTIRFRDNRVFEVTIYQ